MRNRLTFTAADDARRTGPRVVRGSGDPAAVGRFAPFTSWFTISNAEYLQITSSVYDFTGESILNRDSIFLNLSGNVLTSSDIIGAGERVIFTLIYSTQD